MCAKQPATFCPAGDAKFPEQKARRLIKTTHDIGDTVEGFS